MVSAIDLTLPQGIEVERIETVELLEAWEPHRQGNGKTLSRPSLHNKKCFRAVARKMSWA